MPSTSAKQRRTMAAAAHDPAFAAKMGIPTKVAKEFNAADSKAGDLAAMRKPIGNPQGLQHGKAQQATFKPQKDEEKHTPVGRKGMMRGY